MATAYPAALDTLTNPTSADAMNSATVPHATQHANINDAMEAVQAELGTDPAGAYATVKLRLEAIEAASGGAVPLSVFVEGTGISGQFAPTGSLLAVTGMVSAQAQAGAAACSIKLRLRDSGGATVLESPTMTQGAANADDVFTASCSHTFAVTGGVTYDVAIIVTTVLGSANIGSYAGTIVG